MLFSDLDEAKFVPSEASTSSTLTQPTRASRLHTPLPSASTPLSKSALIQPLRKGKRDVLSDFHEQNRLEFDQARRESEQLHEQLLAWEQRKSLRATQKHQQEMLNLEVKKLELEVQLASCTSHNMLFTPSFSGSTDLTNTDGLNGNFSAGL
jgi:hypothetical protein